MWPSFQFKYKFTCLVMDAVSYTATSANLAKIHHHLIGE
jgi:hypothetical protein